MDVKSLKTGDLVTCHYRKDKILKWVAYLIIKDKDIIIKYSDSIKSEYLNMGVEDIFKDNNETYLYSYIKVKKNGK